MSLAKRQFRAERHFMRLRCFRLEPRGLARKQNIIEAIKMYCVDDLACNALERLCRLQLSIT